jgi:hypothetical protein
MGVKTMEMKELVKLVEKWAPMLASNLIGPYSGLVMSILSAAYGTDSKFDLQALADKISSNPYKLKELEIQHREKVGDQLVQLLEIVEGRASNALIWLMAVIFGIAFVAYVIFEMVHNG